MKQTNKALQTLDTPTYGYWSALIHSFYSRYLYVDVGKRWKGFGLLYLLFVISLFSLPFYAQTVMQLREDFQRQIIQPFAKIPSFYIQKGDVIFDKPMPYLIKDEEGNVVIIIDTTGKVNNFTDEYPHLSFLINKNKISYRLPTPQFFQYSSESSLNKSQPIEQSFDKETNLVFDAQQIISMPSISRLELFSEVIAYPIVVALFYSIFLVFYVVLSMLGQLFSQVFYSFKIGFKTASRLLIVSGTPMLLIFFMMFTLHWLFPGSGIVLLFLLMVYYSFALYALRSYSRTIANL